MTVRCDDIGRVVEGRIRHVLQLQQECILRRHLRGVIVSFETHQPLISVIVPCHNSEGTIAACLESITAQTFGDLEIVVVDGLSQDGTMAAVKAVAANFPALRFVSERDNGIYDAINKGVRMARGTWVHVLGSDDRIYSPETLENVAELLKESDAGVVYGDVLVRRDAGWAKDGEIYAGEFTLERLLQRNICQQAAFYKRTLFESLGAFNIDYSICADWDFMLRCAAKSTLEYMNVIVAEFSGGGASGTKEEVKLNEDFAANLYAYFGLHVFDKAFRPVAFRFLKSAKVYAQHRKPLRAILFWGIAKRHGA